MLDILYRYKRTLFTVIFIYALCLFLFSPAKYEYGFNCLCGISYVVSVIVYFMCRRRKNYMDFDTMFFISFFFVSFFYPIFIFPYDSDAFWMFSFPFNENIISKASAVSYLGAVSYMVGGIYCKPKPTVHKLKKYAIIKTTGLFICSIISFVAFVGLGGYQYLIDMYAKNGMGAGAGISSYFLEISYICIFCMISVWFFNSYSISKTKMQWRMIPKLQLLYILIFMSLFLYAGSRGKVINIILLSLGLYTFLYRSFSLKFVILISVIGFIMMAGVRVYRSGGVGGQSGMLIADMAMDLIINNRNTFVAIDMADRDGVTYGTSMLSYFLGVVPFLQGVVMSTFGISPETGASAILITMETLGVKTDLGTGTSIIGDLYLGFGVVGVVVFMWILSRFIYMLQNSAKNNLYSLAMYGIMMGMSIYLARAEFFYSARILVWSACVLYVVKHFRARQYYL